MSQDLGVFIKTLFGEAESARSSKEEEWMKDYLQTKSEYEQDELKKIKRSKMYVPATRVKLNTVLTQVMDFLFPASDERNWDLKPSPRPELHPSVVAHYQQQAAMQGAKLSTEELEKLLDKKAKDSCSAMCEEIADQLVGGSGKKCRKYGQVCPVSLVGMLVLEHSSYFFTFTKSAFFCPLFAPYGVICLLFLTPVFFLSSQCPR